MSIDLPIPFRTMYVINHMSLSMLSSEKFTLVGAVIGLFHGPFMLNKLKYVTGHVTEQSEHPILENFLEKKSRGYNSKYI